LRRWLAALLFLLAPASAAAEGDPWWGKDKALHFGASAVLASGGYAVGALLWEEPGAALASGAALGLGAGVAKELLDLAGMGHPSWKDLAWDVAGTGAGLLVAWTIHQLVAPPPLEPVVVGARSLSLRLSF